MKYRAGLRAALAVAAIVVVSGGVLWLYGPPWGDDRPTLVAAPEALNTAAIKVGPNVLVSRAEAGIAHKGCAVAAHPTDSRRLFSASTLGEYQEVVGYYSHDGGANWHLGCKRPHGPVEQVADEDVAFGPEGGVYFVNMRVPRDTPGAYRYGTEGVGNIDFAYSPDGGKTWEERASIPRYIDRPCFAVDGTRGRVYVNANVEEPLFLTSTDGTRSFSPGLTPEPRVRTTRPSNPVVLADGTVLFTCCVFGSGGSRRVALPLWESNDGGATAAAVSLSLAREWKHDRIKSASVMDVFYPRLAAGPASSRFADRLYCVWRDGHASDQSYILFAASRDRGRTWTDPVVLSEQPMGPDAGREFQADIPSIAVNAAGVIAVTWYDRRGLPGHTVGPGGVIPPSPGYNVRFRVSCDGGETWHPSVRLNEVQVKADRIEARHWAGLAAAADNRFHAAWISDATGTMQLWTTAIGVVPP